MLISASPDMDLKGLLSHSTMLPTNMMRSTCFFKLRPLRCAADHLNITRGVNAAGWEAYSTSHARAILLPHPTKLHLPKGSLHHAHTRKPVQSGGPRLGSRVRHLVLVKVLPGSCLETKIKSHLYIFIFPNIK